MILECVTALLCQLVVVDMLLADMFLSIDGADPEIHQHTLIVEDEFMVVACDGLWDMLSSQRCIEIARQHLRDHNDPQSCAQLLVCQPFSLHCAAPIISVS